MVQDKLELPKAYWKNKRYQDWDAQTFADDCAELRPEIDWCHRRECRAYLTDLRVLENGLSPASQVTKVKLLISEMIQKKPEYEALKKHVTAQGYLDTLNNNRIRAQAFDQWILASRKNVRTTIEVARATMKPQHQHLSLIWWGIIDVSGADKEITGTAEHFTENEIAEMRSAFYARVQLEEIDAEKRELCERIANDVDGTITKKYEDLDDLIDRIEGLRYTRWGNRMRRVIQGSVENLKLLERLHENASEATVDQRTTGYLIKRLIDPMQYRWKTEEGETQSLGSVLARNKDRAYKEKHQAGQKCDLRVILSNTEYKLKGLEAKDTAFGNIFMECVGDPVASFFLEH
ncbi:hypothetical protein HDU86_001224 [Geranomyces michiganensis]|nr:hypothetical protein HDU86_001224 [Geranomyces michiganensis]